MFGLRLGDHPQVVVTTTPKPTVLVKQLATSPATRRTRGSTFDNAANLAPSALAKLKEKYEGTRLGRQELEAEILGDLPGALWSMSSLDAYRKKTADCDRIVVAVDPAASNNPDSDEHGIIVAGREGQEGRVLEDATMQGSPTDWARRTVSLYRSWQADAVVVEVNQGGDMVKHTLLTIDPNINVIEVRASRGKHVRAEPIAALYEQGRIAHVGAFPELETQMTQMTIHGFEGVGSPDRVDALVWAMTAPRTVQWAIKGFTRPSQARTNICCSKCSRLRLATILKTKPTKCQPLHLLKLHHLHHHQPNQPQTI